MLLLKEIGSTNDEARRLISLGHGEGTVVVAGTQVKGRGRLGRRWVSPDGGLYLSIVLKPYISPANRPLITLFASNAVVRTIRGLVKLNAAVKWPNDIVIHGKKVGGILCEATKNSIIVGIGINLNTNISLFPRSLKKLVTSLKFEFGAGLDRDGFLRILLEEFDHLYIEFLHKHYNDIISEWSSSCETLGNKVKIETEKGEIRGIAESVGSKGELRVRGGDGKIRKVNAADILKVRMGDE